MTTLQKLSALTLLFFVAGCGEPTPPAPPARPAADPTAWTPPAAPPKPPAPPVYPMLADGRKGFKTKLVPSREPREKVDEPPPEIFRLVKYDATLGSFAAYLTPDPNDGKKHPAIVWITGGDCNSIGEVWKDAPAKNDQTAAAYRKAGIIMMFPSLRGGNENRGNKEGFYGEVDDVLDAADFLAKQPYVDPDRIYLGGHSTGGTLVLLVAEMSTRFRVVFSFGPVSKVAGYGQDFLPFDQSNPREFELRNPGQWLNYSIKSPVFVFEGSQRPANTADLLEMQRTCTNRQVHFLELKGATHFSALAPMNELIARKILKDDGPTTNLTIDSSELPTSFAK